MEQEEEEPEQVEYENQQLGLSTSTASTATVPISNQTHKSWVSEVEFTQTPTHRGEAQATLEDPSEICEAQTTQSHKFISEGGNFIAVADSVSGIIDQTKEPTPDVSTDPTPPLPPLNLQTPDSPKEKDGSSTESKSEFSQWLSALPQPKPSKTNHLGYTKRVNPLKVQVKLSPTCMTRMSWIWVRKLRESDPKLDWEKLKRALPDGSLLNMLRDTNSDTTVSKSLLDSPWITYLLGKKSLPARIQLTQRSNPTPMPLTVSLNHKVLRTAVKFLVCHDQFLMKGYDSNFIWKDYDSGDISQNLGIAGQMKISVFVREWGHFQEAYAAAMIHTPQDPWYVEVYVHSVLDLLVDWVSECCCFVSWTWSTFEHSKFLVSISQLTNDGWKSNSKNWFGLCSDNGKWIKFPVVGIPMPFDDSETSGVLVDTIPHANNQIESKINLPKAEPLSDYCSEIVCCSEHSDIEEKESTQLTNTHEAWMNEQVFYTKLEADSHSQSKAHVIVDTVRQNLAKIPLKFLSHYQDKECKSVKLYGYKSFIDESHQYRNKLNLAAVSIAKSSGCIFSYDLNLRLALGSSAKAVWKCIMNMWDEEDVIKISKEESIILTGGATPYCDNVVLENLFHSNLKLLIVTEGSKGLRSYTKKIKGIVGGAKIKPVDTIGAGDALISGILYSEASDRTY